MKIPIVITAFAPTDKARATYNHLDDRLRSHFSGTEIIWAYTSKSVSQQSPNHQGLVHFGPEEALRQLAARGVAKVVVQPLQLLPGTEFHDLRRNLARTGMACTTGMPLLTTPADYDELGELWRPLITTRPEKAILILGHGTTHPAWTAYYCLENILRRKFGARIFVGVIEKYPASHDLPDRIKSAGFTEVCIIPLFVVTGMHYHRDILGDGRDSWLTRLTARGLAVEAIKDGLGLLAGFENIVIRHLSQVLQGLGVETP
jgi:sirohydrochlorin cobaltochelatase